MLSFTDFTTAVDYILEYGRGKDRRQLKSTVQQILTELLNDPNYSKRTFEKLLEQSAIFDDDHQELRRQLIVLGARRYTSEDGQELWGLKTKNVSEKPEPPRKRASFTSNLIVGILASMIAALLITILTKLVWPIIVKYFGSDDFDFAVQLATYLPASCSIALAEVELYSNGRVFDVSPLVFQTEDGRHVVIVPAETRADASRYKDIATTAAQRFPNQSLLDASVIDLRSKDWAPSKCTS